MNLGPLTDYRNWVMTSSLAIRGLIFVGVLVAFFAFGLGQETVSAALPSLLVQLVYLVVLLAMVYTLYALGRSFVPGYGNPGE